MSRHYFNPRLEIFTLNSNRPLAEEIAAAVSVELGESSVTQFSDGEIQVNVEESIHGSYIYVIRSMNGPVNDDLMESLIMIDALERASAKTVNVVMSYYGYMRRDRETRVREPITAKLVASMIRRAGVTRMLTPDLHAVQIQGFLDIPVDRLMGAPLIADYFLEKEIKDDDAVVVSPDHGGVTRACKLAGSLKSPIAIIDKRRPRANVAEIMNIIGQVKGKTCVLINDMIDTTGTITLAANALKETGAAGVYTSCTHPVLSGPALQRMEDSAIGRLVVTDLIYLPEDRKIDKIDRMSVDGLMEDAIKRIHENRPVSPLLETENK